MKFSQLLEKVLKEKGITRYRLAKMLNVHQSTIENWVSGKSEPRVDTVRRVAEALEIPVSALMDMSPFYKENAKAPESVMDPAYIERLRKQVEAATAAHIEIAEQGELFLKIYNEYLSDLGKQRIHEYAELLVAKPENLRSGVKPLESGNDT